MSEAIGSPASGQANLNLTAEEKRVYDHLLKEADPDGFGAVSGDVAVKFFERTKLPPDVLGQIWQIADTENRGFLTPAGFGIVLRLIGHAQNGRAPSAQLATQTAPLPRFDNAKTDPPPPMPVQTTGPPASPTPTGPPPIRVPALSPDKVAEYSALFEKSGAENGFLPGLVAKQIFERARLPNDVLGRIWALSDTQGRGSLEVTEFVIAMHLLASYKSGQMRGVPNSLPAGLYEAAARRTPARMGSGSRTTSAPFAAVPPQFTGYSARPQSPITRQQNSTPLSVQSTGDGWVITPADKARFDSVFATVDRQGRGFITGEQAVEFFGNARLPEEILAQIWDLADINSEGQLNKDEFAVAMYLIRQQRGTKDGRGNLPPTLPPSLVPPSMRKLQIPPPQTTAPAFENATITKPRSAADDLFGLDAFGPSSAAPAPAPAPANVQVAQSTGGTDAGPFANPPAASTTFKPFIPSSTFGQSIVPQTTGSPVPGQARAAPNEDLLGDADPDVSSKLTSETSELGNLSNQVGSLSKQTTDLQNSRKQTEQELSNTTAQKRAFEGRLAQLRSLYDKEVQEVKVLQEQLTTSRNETKRLQQDMAMIDGTHQDLSTQHQQLKTALEADQRENAALKERIRDTNQEVDQLRTQLEKLKSDARQQKGLVAINKKQLATNEAERDRLRAEIAAAQKQVEEAQREAVESSREVEASKKELEEARMVPVPSIKSPPPVVSPALSTSSNPFFRRTTEPSFLPPGDPGEPKESQNTFDNIFGPSYGGPTAPPPAVSFSGQSPPQASATPDTSRGESTSASSTPKNVVEPPAPPSSRQITSAALPLFKNLDREESISSSIKVAPPGSRLSPADTPRAGSPGTSVDSPQERRGVEEDPFTTEAAPDEEQESIRRTLPQASSSPEPIGEHKVGPASTGETGGIPGAFPTGSRSDTPSHSVNPTLVAAGAGVATIAAAVGVTAAATNGPDKSPANDSGESSKATERNFDEYFGGPAHQRSASEQAADFDSAFAGMPKGRTANGTASAGNKEFPDIREFGGEEDDDDDSSDDSEASPMKFDDDFNARSPPRGAPAEGGTKAGKQPESESAPSAGLLLPRPPLEGPSSTATSLPDADQQASPPTYGDSVPSDNPTHFPREYKGLLPERDDPTSPPFAAGASAPVDGAAKAHAPAYGPEAHPRTPSVSKGVVSGPTHPAAFDFDSAFSGMGAAPVVDDEGDDDESDEVFSPAKTGMDFDPTFDTSPPRPTSGPTAFAHDSVTNGAVDQGVSSISHAAPSVGSATSPVSHDWDDLFARLDSTTTGSPGVPPPQSEPLAMARAPAPAPAPATDMAVPATHKPERPQPGRALSTGTEHDDPILKRLTSMGWSREESLSALEKFDYNIDKAADYLTFRS